MRPPCCASVYPYILPSTFESLTNVYETWCVYHGTWAHLNGVLHKSFPSVCVSLCVSPLSVLCNGSVNTSPQQRIHATIKSFVVPFSMWFVSCQWKVGDYFFPELLFFILTPIFRPLRDNIQKFCTERMEERCEMSEFLPRSVKAMFSTKCNETTSLPLV
jgi:hypothetical protein